MYWVAYSNLTWNANEYKVHKHHQRYIRFWGCTSGAVYVPSVYWRRLESLLLCFCDVFRSLINPLVCWSRTAESTLATTVPRFTGNRQDNSHWLSWRCAAGRGNALFHLYSCSLANSVTGSHFLQLHRLPIKVGAVGGNEGRKSCGSPRGMWRSVQELTAAACKCAHSEILLPMFTFLFVYIKTFWAPHLDMNTKRFAMKV